MSIDPCLVIVRGGGDLGTGVIFRLRRAGFPVIALELAHPLVVRRRVAVATAVLEGEIVIEDIRARLVDTVNEAEKLAFEGIVPVLVASEFEAVVSKLSQPVCVVVDARMSKRNIDTNIDQAPLVIGLGPGFSAGEDCHAVIETKRGHTLGRVIRHGAALPNTGTPGVIGGRGSERVLRAPADGVVTWHYEIGISVVQDQLLGTVHGLPILAPFPGVIRGLIAPGSKVHQGMKIGDVDARAEVLACFTVSDKALAIAGGVLEAMISHLVQSSSEQ